MGKRIVIVKPVSRDQLELEAQQRLLDFQPTCLNKPEAVNVEKFFELRLPRIANVKPDYKKLEPGVDGLTNAKTLRVIVSSDLMDSDLVQDRRRARATIAHESDHAIRHIPQYRRMAEIGLINCSGKSLLFRQEDIKPISAILRYCGVMKAGFSVPWEESA